MLLEDAIEKEKYKSLGDAEHIRGLFAKGMDRCDVALETGYPTGIIQRVFVEYQKEKTMPKKAKVTKCDFTKSFETKYGELHGFAVEFDNGDSGFYTSKSKDQNNFVVGQEADYEIKETKGQSGKPYNKIAPHRENTFGGGGKASSDKSIRSQVALKAAVETVVSHPKFAEEDMGVMPGIIVNIAGEYFEFLESHS